MLWLFVWDDVVDGDYRQIEHSMGMGHMMQMTIGYIEYLLGLTNPS